MGNSSSAENELDKWDELRLRKAKIAELINLIYYENLNHIVFECVMKKKFELLETWFKALLYKKWELEKMNRLRETVPECDGFSNVVVKHFTEVREAFDTAFSKEIDGETA